MFIDKISSFLNIMGSEITGLYGNYLIVALLTIFLGIATYTDMKTLKISNKLNGIFLVIRFLCIPILGFGFSHVGGSLFTFFMFFLPAMVFMHKMAGDIKTGTIMGLYLGIYIAPLFVALSCLSGMLYILLKGFVFKKRVGNIPFAPCFFFAHICIFALSLFL